MKKEYLAILKEALPIFLGGFIVEGLRQIDCSDDFSEFALGVVIFPLMVMMGVLCFLFAPLFFIGFTVLFPLYWLCRKRKGL